MNRTLKKTMSLILTLVMLTTMLFVPSVATTSDPTLATVSKTAVPTSATKTDEGPRDYEVSLP